jgi:hypothetical protein
MLPFLPGAETRSGKRGQPGDDRAVTRLAQHGLPRSLPARTPWRGAVSEVAPPWEVISAWSRDTWTTRGTERVSDAIRAKVHNRVPERAAIARKVRKPSATRRRSTRARSRCKSTAFARGGPAAENRGVPGSSPGLATPEKSCIHASFRHLKRSSRDGRSGHKLAGLVPERGFERHARATPRAESSMLTAPAFSARPSFAAPVSVSRPTRAETVKAVRM